MGQGKMIFLFKIRQLCSKTNYKIQVYMKSMQRKTNTPLALLLQFFLETLKRNGK